MRLKSFNYLIGLLIIFFCSHLVGEDKIDIWDNKKEINKESTNNQNLSIQKNQNINSSQTLKAIEKIEIQDGGTILAD